MIQVVHDADPYGHLTSIHNGRDALQPHQSAAHARQHPERLGRRGRRPGGAVPRRLSQADRVRRDQVRRRHSAALGQPVGRGDGAPLLGVHHRGHVSRARRMSTCIRPTCCGGRKAACCAARARRGSRSCATSWRRRRPRGSSRSTSGKFRTSRGKPGEYYLVYFGAESPRTWKFQLPRRKRDDPSELAGGMRFHVDVLDTWNMTITPIDEPFTIRQPAETDYVVTDDDGQLDRLAG